MIRSVRLAVVLALLWACGASAQSQFNQGSLSSTTCPGATGCVSLSVSGVGGVGVQVTGTFVGTLTFEGSVDGTTFSALNLTAINSTTGASTTTTTGVFTGGVGGLSIVRVRMSAYTSGTAVVRIQNAPTAARLGGGGGGGGTITGTIAAGQVAFGTGANEIGGDAAWTFDPGSGTPASVLFSSTAVANAYTQEIFGPLDGPDGIYVRGFSDDGMDWNYVFVMDSRRASFTGNLVDGGVAAFTAYNTMEGVPGDITGAFRSIVDLNLGGGTMPSDQWLTEYISEGVQIHDGTVPLTASFYMYPPEIDGDAHVGMHTYIWQNDLSGLDIDNPYYLWMDPQGVLRYKNDESHDMVGQAVLGFYNPLFTKYTPGAVDFERYTEYWDGNTVYIGAEAGGTGTLRNLGLLGSQVVGPPASDFTFGAQTGYSLLLFGNGNTGNPVKINGSSLDIGNSNLVINSGDVTISAVGTGQLHTDAVFTPAGYKSSDGTAGVTVTTCTGFKDGLCISGT